MFISNPLNGRFCEKTVIETVKNKIHVNDIIRIIKNFCNLIDLLSDDLVCHRPIVKVLFHIIPDQSLGNGNSYPSGKIIIALIPKNLAHCILLGPACKVISIVESSFGKIFSTIATFDVL